MSFEASWVATPTRNLLTYFVGWPHPNSISADRTNAKSAFEERGEGEGGSREGELANGRTNGGTRDVLRPNSATADAAAPRRNGRKKNDGPKNWPYIFLSLTLRLSHDIDTDTEMRHRSRIRRKRMRKEVQ